MKKPISNHITPFIVSLLLAYCWRTAGPLLSVLFMTSVHCCRPNDVMTCFKTPDLLQNGGSSVGSPAWPRRGVIKVVMPGNFLNFPIAERSEWEDEQTKLLSHHLRILLQILFNVWHGALIHAWPTGNKQVT